jgi:tetratricopeptide (TPR) repeat protein
MNRKEILRRLVENPTNGNALWHVAESLFQELQSHRDRDEEKALWAAVCYRLAAHFEDTAESWGRAGTRLAQLRLAPLVQVECFTKALEKDPHNVRNLKGRALVYKHLGKFNEALEDLEQACRQGEVDYEIHLNMGECYHHLGRPESARECFRKALEAASTQNPAHIKRVQKRIRQLGYGDLLPATATKEVPDPKAGLRARIDELVHHGLPTDLADYLQERIEGLSLEEAKRVVEKAARFWELHQQGSLTEEEVRHLLKGS